MPSAMARVAMFAYDCSKSDRAYRALPKLPTSDAIEEQVSEPLGHALGELDLGGRGHALEYLDQLGRRVVREVDVVGEPAAQSRVRVDEPLHLLRVAGGDDRQVVAVVLHQLDQLGDRLGPELPAALHRQRVRLVDEQDATDRLLDRGLRP